jgi:hypothetical protein
MDERQLHELLGRLTIQNEVLRLALVEAEKKIADLTVEEPAAPPAPQAKV